MGTVTIGSATYATWGTYNGTGSADEYANGSFAWAATWTAAAVDDRKRALVESTRILARQTWNDDTQALVDASTPSDAMIQACYELALAALADASVLTVAALPPSAKVLRAGPVEIENFAPGPRPRFPAAVMELIGSLLGGATISDTSAASYVSGTSDCSSFDESDEYTLTRSG